MQLFKIKTMKIISFKNLLFLGALSAASFSFQSCTEEWLDLRPEGRPTGDEVPIGGLEASAFGLYASLRTNSGLSDFSYLWTHSIRADDNEKGSTASDASTDGNVFNNFAYVATNGHIANAWNGPYRLIYDANDLITKGEALTDATTGTLVNIAEAKAIRAYAFFQLRRDFGEVPVNLKLITSPEDEIAPKNTIAQVEAQIISDLMAAR